MALLTDKCKRRTLLRCIPKGDLVALIEDGAITDDMLADGSVSLDKLDDDVKGAITGDVAMLPLKLPLKEAADADEALETAVYTGVSENVPAGSGIILAFKTTDADADGNYIITQVYDYKSDDDGGNTYQRVLLQDADGNVTEYSSWRALEQPDMEPISSDDIDTLLDKYGLKWLD